MANYTIVDWISTADTPTAVAAAMETKLEALDSTTNPIYYIDLIPAGGIHVQGIILYKG